MSAASLTFNLPEESHEFKAAANAGSLQAAIQDVDQTLRQREKYGKPSEQRFTVSEMRSILRTALREHDAEWALD